MPIFLGIVYGIIMFIIGLFFIVKWYRMRADLYYINDFGNIVGGTFVVANIVIVIASFGALFSSVPSSIGLICGMVIGLVIGFFRMGAFAVIGIYFATLVKMPRFPLLTKKWGIPHDVKYEQILQLTQKDEEKETFEGQDEPIDGEDNQSGINIDNKELISLPAEMTADQYDSLKVDAGVDNGESNLSESAELIETDAPQVIDKRFYILSTSLVTIGAILYSIVLFTLTKPSPSEYVQNLGFGVNDSQVYEVTFVAIVTVLLFALSEEIVFRLGIQNFLAYQFKWQGEKYWIAILLTASLWTIGHTATLSPDWVKLAQIFPVGIALGWLYKKNGTESVMIAHALFNVVLVFLAQNLIQV